MDKAFNNLMQVISSLLGLLLVAMGSVWILQGLGIAFLDSFMANDLRWSFNGAVLAAIGVAQVYWSNTRKRYYQGK